MSYSVPILTSVTNKLSSKVTRIIRSGFFVTQSCFLRLFLVKNKFSYAPFNDNDDKNIGYVDILAIRRLT